MKTRVLIAAALVAAAGVRAAAPVSAQDRARAEEVAKEAESQLRSPVTPFHTLDMCPSAEATALRDTVLAEALAGSSVREIVDGVIARRGEKMRILPRESGVGLWAWVMPPVVLLLGIGVVAMRISQLRRARAGLAEAEVPRVSDVERARLEAALREFDRTEAAQ